MLLAFDDTRTGHQQQRGPAAKRQLSDPYRSRQRHGFRVFEFRVSSLGNQSSSIYPLPSTLDPKPCLLDSLPSTLDPRLLSHQRSLDELPEQGVRPLGTRLELGVELPAYEPGVIRQLDHLDQSVIRREAGQSHSVLFQDLPILVVDLIPVSMPLADLIGAVRLVSQGGDDDTARIGPEPHGSSQVSDAALLRHQIDDRVRAVGFELAAIGALQSAHVAGQLNLGTLHPQADP